jgi:hypothetical protein
MTDTLQLKRGDRIKSGKRTGTFHAIVGRTVWFHTDGGLYVSAPLTEVEKAK